MDPVRKWRDIRGVIDVHKALSAVSIVLLLSIVIVGCDNATGADGETGSVTSTGTPTAGVSPSESPDEPGGAPGDIKAEDFSAELFDTDSANIENEWWPLEPGTRFIWKGRAFEGGKRVERRVVFTVTDLTKVIAGVRTRVGWDRDFNNGVLGEGELIFLAQDTQGNVWHLGQYREVYEDEFVGGRVWVVGDPEGAEAGLLMKAEPRLGGTDYSQGFAPPPWDWDDRARVYRMGVQTCIPVGCFDDVLITEEFEPSVPGASQLKFYARGVGNIRVGWRGAEEEEKEVMVLVQRLRLSAEELAAANTIALELEHRAYAYGRLSPAELTPSDG